jgi:hypothetical protein
LRARAESETRHRENVSLSRDGRVVFNIAGNKYRIVVWINYPMEQTGLTPKDLEPMIGQRNRVYEVLNRKRPLTMKMAWRLHCELGIPARPDE